MPGNPNYNAVLSTTLQNYVSKRLEDNVFSQCPTLNAIKAKSGTSTKGGEKLIVPLLYGKNTTVQAMTPYGVFDTSPQEGITAAEYSWANLGGTVVLDNFTIQVVNAGEAKIIDLLEAKIFQLEQSMIDLINSELWASGGRPANGAYQLWGFEDIFNHTGSSTYTDPTYAGDGAGYGNIPIASNANTWWRPSKTHSATTMSLQLINHVYNTCSNGNDVPNLIVTTQEGYEAIESLLIATYRSGPDSALSNAGIEHINHKGCPIIFDKACSAGCVYFLNTKYLKFFTCEGRNMQATPFVEPHNQDVRISRIVWSGQIGCSNRSRQGLLSGITNA